MTAPLLSRNLARGARALIVHDDATAAGALAADLKKRGYRVDVVDSGLAAIRQVWEERYDEVLVDTGLRGMGARQLLIHLAQLAPETRVALLERQSEAA